MKNLSPSGDAAPNIPPMRTGRRSNEVLSLAAMLFAAACSAVQKPLPEAEQHIANAEALIRTRAIDQAREVLALVEGEACPVRLRDRRDVALATCQFAQGEAWEAFLVLEQFPDLHPHSDLRPTVVEMVWDIGSTLATRGGGFLFFWSDRRAARTVLEHLITRHPDTPRLADALHLLGDMAYEDENHELAQERFRELMKERPESEWVGYARFKFAMSLFASLQGPDYDLDKMNHATRELRDFLRDPTENPDLVATARRALAQLLDWQSDRHLRLAAFYRRVGNVQGQRYHLEIAASPDFAATSFHAQAEAERQALETAGSTTAENR